MPLLLPVISDSQPPLPFRGRAWLLLPAAVGWMLLSLQSFGVSLGPHLSRIMVYGWETLVTALLMAAVLCIPRPQAGFWRWLAFPALVLYATYVMQTHLPQAMWSRAVIFCWLGIFTLGMVVASRQTWGEWLIKVAVYVLLCVSVLHLPIAESGRVFRCSFFWLILGIIGNVMTGEAQGNLLLVGFKARLPIAATTALLFVGLVSLPAYAWAGSGGFGVEQDLHSLLLVHLTCLWLRHGRGLPLQLHQEGMVQKNITLDWIISWVGQALVIIASAILWFNLAAGNETARGQDGARSMAQALFLTAIVTIGLSLPGKLSLRPWQTWACFGTFALAPWVFLLF